MNLEHYRANELPYIPETNFTSAKAGSVELFWPEDSAPDENLYQKIKLESELFAKDPWDIVDKDSTVAIDFGTSSTVVMIKDSRGTTIPLRMGGFGRELKARNFENPTVLEFINFKRFMDAWSKEPYKPLTSWNDVKSSFDAKEELHDHASSGITNIKSWAKTKNKMKPTILVDEKNQVFELSPLEIKEENCTDLGDFDQRPLDPIEVYGYYLGLFLNNEALNNGHIYLNYILSYPVKFDKETKKRILQGLRRGIIRSLPPSLIYSKKWKDIGEEEFHVELFVSEPVALAAAALPFLKIEPNESNSFKTVFCIYDFGGGTTDFAVGFFRKATEQEYEDYGKEFIIDILNIHGIENLGGEHLVDCIAYEVLRDNALKLQQNNLTFVMPNDFYAFVGSEKLWHTGEESYGNFAILREAVRPLWERGDQLSNIKTAESINGLHFKNSLGNNVEISLDVDISRIEEIIKEKLQRAINEFFDFIEASIKHYFDERKIEETSEQNNLENINIVLSGNSCKSEIFLDLLNETCEKYRKKYSKGPSNNNKNNSTSENLKISTELIENSKDTVSNELKGKTDVFLRPNLKNSVALGLLKLYTENIEYINHFENENISDEFEQEAPFDFYIGKFENNIFKPCLNRNAKFNAWKEFDKVKKTMRQTDKPRFSIAWTKNSSVERNREEINIDNCQKKSITLKRDYIGYKIYIRPIGPSKIEVGLSETDESTIERILEISLDE